MVMLHRHGYAQWDDYTEAFLIEGTTQASWLGCGMSLADFNLDGLEDITLANSDGSVTAYAQLPAGGFAASHELEGSVQGQGLAWLDVDGDDDLDLMVSRRFGRTELYIRDGETLTEQGIQRGFPDDDSGEGRGLAVADYDGDGDLDVYICMYHDGTTGLSENQLYNNDGTGHFTDVTASAGVGNGIQHTFQAVWFDEDEDGDLDLWVINDRTIFPNALYQNLGDGTFVDVAPDLNLAQGIFAMTATVGDPDNDGDAELFCTNVENEPNLMLDKTSGPYISVGPAWDVDGMRYSWGACWVDADGDMWSDLMVGTYRFPNSLPYDNYFYVNNQYGQPFSDETDSWPNEQTQIYAVGVIDFDQDLAPDVCAFGNAPFAQMIRNVSGDAPSPPHRLAVELCSPSGNRQAIGAKVAVHAGGLTQTQWVTNGSDFMTQQSTHRYFGLADNNMVDSVVVEWPGGLRETWADVVSDQVLRLVEGATTAGIAITGGACDGDTAWIHFPFDAPVKRWNGIVVEGDSLPLAVPGTYVLECEWLSGLFSWSDTVEWAPADAHALTVEWTEPLCAGEPGLLGWSASAGLDVLFEGTGSQVWSSAESNVAAVGGLWDWITIDPTTGCEEVHTFTLPEPPALEAFVTFSPALCNGDVASAQVAGYGGTPGYLVNWNGANPTDLMEGEVTVTLSDAAGCQLDSTWSVVHPDPLEFTVSVTPEDAGGDGEIALLIEGGTPPYGILWNEGTENDTVLVGLSQGVYSWVIQDANGCLSLGLQEMWNLSAQEPLPENLSWHMAEGAPVLRGGPESGMRMAVFTLDGRLVWEDQTDSPCPCPLPAQGIPAHGVLRVLGPDGAVLLRAVY